MFQQSDDSEGSDYANYQIWLASVKEMDGWRAVCRKTYAFLAENRSLRAEVQRLKRTAPTPQQQSTPALRRESSGNQIRDERGERSRAAIMDYLVSYFSEHQQAPSLREIGRATSLTQASVSRHLRRLERDGKLVLQVGVERGITLK